jgi:hypothetical protein
MESSAGFFLENGEWKPIAAKAGNEVARRSARVALANNLERQIMVSTPCGGAEAVILCMTSVFEHSAIGKRWLQKKIDRRDTSGLAASDEHPCYPAI